MRSLLLRFCFPLVASALIASPGLHGQGTSGGGRWNVNWDQVNGTLQSWSLSDRIEGPIHFGGWASAGLTSNAHGNRSGNGNAPLPLNNVADGLVANQVWGYAEKSLDPHCGCWDWGFRVDYVFGTDGPDIQAVGDQGWDFGWNSSRDYGSSIPQLYVEAGTEEFALLAGYFFGLQGFEATPAIDNFFYSHNYAFGYGVPGTHAGVLATCQLTEDLEVDAGWSTGWNSSWANHLGASTFIGGFTWRPTEEASLTYHLTAGDFGDGAAKNGAASNDGTIYSHAIVLTQELSGRSTYVLENTFGSNTGIGEKNNQWYSLTNYLFYEISDCWEAGARVEWFRDDDGRRVDVNGAGPGSFYEASLGLNCVPCGNLRVRPELRWDWFDGEGRPFDSRDGGKSGTEVNQFTGSFDVLLIF